MKLYLTIAICLFGMSQLPGQEPVDTSSVPEPAEPLFFETGTDVYKIVEVMPRFPGCEELGTKEEKEDCSMRKLVEFVYSNIQYPEEARNNSISGTVIIGFIVEKDGALSNLKIVRDIGGGCGQEGLRVIEMMPKWIPGTQRGTPVRVEYQLPIKFSVH
ncbi:MAG: energy transducer TonB [Lewinellaceae bacterium]|nr:energy transducer TonB [Lewinellaceae bacterium]